jgi:succinate dehydrogenase/fumarate reductase flavoprotein subunit
MYAAPINEIDYNISELKQKLKDLMWNNVGILRSEEKLLEASSLLKTYKKNFLRTRKCLNIEEYEYRNMLTVAELIIQASLNRKESIGAHSRIDTITPKKKELENVK